MFEPLITSVRKKTRILVVSFLLWVGGLLLLIRKVVESQKQSCSFQCCFKVSTQPTTLSPAPLLTPHLSVNKVTFDLASPYTWEQRARRMSPMRMMRRTRTEMIAMKIQTKGVTWRSKCVSWRTIQWQSLCEYEEGLNVYFGRRVWSDLPIWMPKTFHRTLHHIQKMA